MRESISLYLAARTLLRRSGRVVIYLLACSVRAVATMCGYIYIYVSMCAYVWIYMIASSSAHGKESKAHSPRRDRRV